MSTSSRTGDERTALRGHAGRVLLVTPALLAAFLGAYVVTAMFNTAFTPVMRVAVALMHALAVVAAALALRVERASGSVPGRDDFVLGMGLFAMTLANWGYVLVYRALTDRPFPREGAYLTVVVHAAALALLIRFATQFPAPLRATSLPPQLGFRLPFGRRRVILGRAAHALQRLLLARWFVASSIVIVTLCAALVQNVSIPFMPDPFELVTAVAVVLVAFSLRTGYISAGAEDRRRIRWILLGFVAAGAVMAVSMPLEVLRANGMLPGLPDWSFIPFTLAVAALLFCLGLAVLYRGDFEPGLAIERTAVISAVASLTLLALAAVQDLVVGRLASWLGASQATIGALCGVLIGYTMGGVQRRLSTVLSRTVIPNSGTPARLP